MEVTESLQNASVAQLQGTLWEQTQALSPKHQMLPVSCEILAGRGSQSPMGCARSTAVAKGAPGTPFKCLHFKFARRDTSGGEALEAYCQVTECTCAQPVTSHRTRLSCTELCALKNQLALQEECYWHRVRNPETRLPDKAARKYIPPILSHTLQVVPSHRLYLRTEDLFCIAQTP